MASSARKVKPKDNILPSGKWEFDSSVTDVFEDMLGRSIPQYEVMRQAVTDLARHFVKPHTCVVDIGCSRGDAMAPLVDLFGAHNRFVGLEISEPMLAAARERFKGYIQCGVVDIRQHDLRGPYPTVNASVTLSVLTLQFVPIEYRQRLLRSIYLSTCTGGALILVEKVLGNTAEIDEIMVERYYDMKRANGYSEEQIQRKRLALEGVLVPMTAAFNEQLMRAAGFQAIDCFWRWMNFCGWIALK